MITDLFPFPPSVIVMTSKTFFKTILEMITEQYSKQGINPETVTQEVGSIEIGYTILSNWQCSNETDELKQKINHVIKSTDMYERLEILREELTSLKQKKTMFKVCVVIFLLLTTRYCLENWGQVKKIFKKYFIALIFLRIVRICVTKAEKNVIGKGANIKEFFYKNICIGLKTADLDSVVIG